MPTFEGVDIPGDLVKFHDDPSYCLVSTFVRNETGATLTNAEVTGQPVQYVPASDHAILIVDTAEGNANGVIVSKLKIDSLATASNYGTPVAVLVRGPATVWDAGLPTNDVEGDALNLTTIKTQLEGLNPPVIVQAKGTILEEIQTT